MRIQQLEEHQELKEQQQLNEWVFLPWLVPALATAVRIGAPAVGRFLARQFVTKGPSIVRGTGNFTA